ncbi:MAG: DnaD domain protein [Clostridia bacterium]|nr:DnaD domain protein [Clostridia bacterium]
MKYEINYGNGVVCVPVSALDKLSQAGETELRVLLALCSGAEDIASATGLEEASIASSLAFWRGAGIISGEKKTAERKVSRHATVPTYTGEDLSRIIDENGLSAIIDECQSLTGRVFNITEVNRIAALNSYLGLSGEYILLLFSYCAEHGKTTLKYIEKTAYDLYDRGIDSTEALEEYIRREEAKHTLENKLRKLFGWGERTLTPSEKKHISTWSDEYNYTFDIIEEAYFITIEKAQKFSIQYLSKILYNWNNSNLRTLEDVKASLARYEKAKSEEQQNTGSSFDVDEFFELALKRSRDKILND